MDFLSAMAISANDEIAYGKEKFDPAASEWRIILAMLNAHARELRGMETRLNIGTYGILQTEGRLLIIGARRKDNGAPVGYSIHIWYDDLHFGLRLALDDAWFVFPQYRNRGIGRRLREIALEELRKVGVNIALARIKIDHNKQFHNQPLEQLGYRPYEIVYRKDL
jgi:GNAT superfamily N-acetyltransferase